MATAYISEYPDLPTMAGGRAAPMFHEASLLTQTVAIGGGSVQSSAFSNATHAIRVNVDTTCSYAVGANPTATTSTARMTGGATESFHVNAGDKIAFIANS